MENLKKNYKEIMLVILFLGVLCSGVYLTAINSNKIIKVVKTEYTKVKTRKVTLIKAFKEFERRYDAIFSTLELPRDVFSLTQKMLLKKETRRFEVLKADSGVLYLPRKAGSLNAAYIGKIAKQSEEIYLETIKYGGKFIYVQVPYKNVGQAQDLVDYSQDVTEEEENTLVALLQMKGIPVLDLRKYDDCKQYYRTDHHWTVLSAFNAAAIITAELEKRYGLTFARRKEYGDIANYQVKKYPRSFLGSIGIKVGKYYAGKDDFVIYNPKFETDIRLRHFKQGKLNFEFKGNFWNAFVNQALLDNPNYNNKYDANLHGAYVETIVDNKLYSNEYKGLFISHSYGRPLTQYLSLNFRELRYLDPQKGRYNDSYVEYIRKFRPDVVILMYNWEFIKREKKIEG